MVSKKLFLIFLIIIHLSISIFSSELSDGYKEFKLGMSKSEVESLLNQSTDFFPKTEEVLTIRIEPDTEIITVEGRGFIEIGYFHFNNDKLFQIFIKISETKIGYYMLLKRLTAKFGNPKSLEPKSAFWENDKVKIVIEKPCTIKYLNLSIWNDLTKKDPDLENIIEKAREDFVDEL